MEFYWAFIFMTFVLFIIAVLSSETIRDVSIILGLLNILLSLYMKQISLKEHSLSKLEKNNNDSNKDINKNSTKKDILPQIFEDEINTDIQVASFENFGDGVQNSTINKDKIPKINKKDLLYEINQKHLPKYKHISFRQTPDKIIGKRYIQELVKEQPQYSSKYTDKKEYTDFINNVDFFPNNTSNMDDKTIKNLGGTASTLKQRILRRGNPKIEHDKLRYDKWRNKYNKDYNLQRRAYEPNALNKFFEQELHENERLQWWGYY
jgi:hypothetical protein